MKNKKLSLSLLLKVSVLFILSFFTIGIMSVNGVKKYNRSNITIQTSESVKELLWIIANVNSVLMQQMRTYTMLNDVCHTEKDPLKIQKELQHLSDRRYKDFREICYVDYETGLEYSDTGEIREVKDKDYFIKMFLQRRKDKSLQLYGDINENEWYTVCKDNEVKTNGYCNGFFVGKVNASYLQRYLNKIKGNSFDFPFGFVVVINKELLHICSPDKSVSLIKKFEPSENLIIDPKLLDFISNPLDTNEKNEKITVSGDVEYNGKKYLMTAGLFSKTDWTLAMVIPYSYIDKCTNNLIVIILCFSISLSIISLILLNFTFKRTFEPLEVLNDSFISIAKGEADLTNRLRITDNYEIGRIQKSFNEYLSQLQGAVSQIGEAKNKLVNVEVKLGTILKRIQKEILKINNSVEILKKEDSNPLIFKELESNISSIEFVTNEMEQAIKSSYEAVNKLSESTEGFIY